jgi:hypothetical protein
MALIKRRATYKESVCNKVIQYIGNCPNKLYPMWVLDVSRNVLSIAQGTVDDPFCEEPAIHDVRQSEKGEDDEADDEERLSLPSSLP